MTVFSTVQVWERADVDPLGMLVMQCLVECAGIDVAHQPDAYTIHRYTRMTPSEFEEVVEVLVETGQLEALPNYRFPGEQPQLAYRLTPGGVSVEDAA